MNIIQWIKEVCIVIITLCMNIYLTILISIQKIYIFLLELCIENIYQYCIDYELKIKEDGGLDFQLLGIGRTGHIGFNEPGSHFNSGTRSITLDYITE